MKVQTQQPLKELKYAVDFFDKLVQDSVNNQKLKSLRILDRPKSRPLTNVCISIRKE